MPVNLSVCLLMLAQGILAWDLGRLLIVAVVIAGLVAIAVVVAREAFGVAIPPWVAKVAWIVFAVIFAVAAIKFLLAWV